VVFAENGITVDLVDGLATVSGAVDVGFVYVDGLAVGDVREASLKDRRILGDEGFVTITTVVDAASGKVISGPDFSARGFSDEPGAFDEARRLVEDVLNKSLAEGVSDPAALSRLIRRTVGKWVHDTYRRRPMVVPVVVEV
jgi:ribonuclease J